MSSVYEDVEHWLHEASRHLQEIPGQIGNSVYAYSEAIYAELTRYGNPVPLPSMQQIEDRLPKDLVDSCKSLSARVHGNPPPPPPPPPSLAHGWYAASADWAHRHARMIQVAGGVTVVGLGSTWAYQRGYLWLPILGRKSPGPPRVQQRVPLTKNGIRKEAVVVIGADTPLGRALALHLSAVGFVVIASVASNGAVATFNSIVPPSSRGYIKAIQFETSDVSGSLGKFVRSVDEVLRLRFPLLSAGDPYAAPGDEVSLVGIVNALSYLAPSLDVGEQSQTAIGPAQSFQKGPAELAESLEKHIVASLCAISALQPLLASSRGSIRGTSSSKPQVTSTVVNLLSSPVSHTSLPGAGIESVVSQAIAAGLEVMRREADDRAGRELPPVSSSLMPVSSASPRRTLRMTMVEIDEGRPWGSAALPLLSESSEQRATQGSDQHTPTRPSVSRKASNSAGSSWQVRDAATQVVLSKVTSILLTPDPSKRLKPSYRVYLPNAEQHFVGRAFLWINRATQRMMRVLPTSWVDVLLALRRHVSLRRAGLISQGPTTGRKASHGNAASAGVQGSGTSSSAAFAGSARGGVSPGGAASMTQSRASASRSSNLSGNTGRGQNISVSSDEGYNLGENEGATTSGPPSLPDSNSGESLDGMVSSGVLSSNGDHQNHDQQAQQLYQGHPTASSRGRPHSADVHETTSNPAYSSSASSLHDGPWLGPSGQNSPVVQHDDETDDTPSSSTNMASSGAHLGESWIRLGESEQRGQRGGAANGGRGAP